MYISTGVVGTTAGAGTLAFTGFGITGYIIVAVLLILAGTLALRSGRRRAARR
jgi:hypothetical protein